VKKIIVALKISFLSLSLTLLSTAQVLESISIVSTDNGAFVVAPFDEGDGFILNVSADNPNITANAYNVPPQIIVNDLFGRRRQKRAERRCQAAIVARNAAMQRIQELQSAYEDINTLGFGTSLADGTLIKAGHPDYFEFEREINDSIIEKMRRAYENLERAEADVREYCKNQSSGN